MLWTEELSQLAVAPFVGSLAPELRQAMSVAARRSSFTDGRRLLRLPAAVARPFGAFLRLGAWAVWLDVI